MEILRKNMRKIKNFILNIRDFPKSVYVNLKCLPFVQAVKLPIKVRWDINIDKMSKNSIEIKCDNIQRYMIKIGYQGAKFVPKSDSYVSIINNGKIIFFGTAVIAEGINLFIDNGVLEIGKNFYANRNLQIQCEKKIAVLDNCLLGWNVEIRDTDGHHIVHNKIQKEYRKEIVIGKHVWVAADVTILKGSKIANDCIVACRSVIGGLQQDKENCLLAGIPAKNIKENIEWIE